MQHEYRAGPARHEGPALPSGEREHEPNCARAFRPRALQSISRFLSPHPPLSLYLTPAGLVPISSSS